MTYRIRFCTLVLVLLASFSASLTVAQSERYFSAEVPVKGQSRQEREQAAELGLLDVLVRMSGDENVRLDDNVLSDSRQAIRYVQQFQYDELTDEAALSEDYSALLRFKYSDNAVREFLTRHGYPFWSVKRPVTLVWLVEDSVEYGKQFVPHDPAHPLIQGVEKQASYRGVPLSFPLQDFQDQMALGAERLWALDEQAILDASARYDADVVLVGKFTETSSGQIWSNWQFFHLDQSRVYDVRAEEALQLGASAIDPLADFLAARYAVDTGANQDSAYIVHVRNIHGFADYRGLFDLLSRLDAIESVQVDLAHQDRLQLRVSSDATVEQLVSLLRLGNHLFAEAAGGGEVPGWQQAPLGSLANPLRYRWER